MTHAVSNCSAVPFPFIIPIEEPKKYHNISILTEDGKKKTSSVKMQCKVHYHHLKLQFTSIGTKAKASHTDMDDMP